MIYIYDILFLDNIVYLAYSIPSMEREVITTGPINML